MKIIADTNIIVRLIVQPNTEADLQQAKLAANIIDQAARVIIPTHVFCELAWVLSSVYKLNTVQTTHAIQSVFNLNHLIIKEDEVEAGLHMLTQGGDFADGINAYTEQSIANGNAVFVSFDKQAVRLFTERGISALVPM